MSNEMKNVLILGGSKGLGLAIKNELGDIALSISRSDEIKVDLSKPDSLGIVKEVIQSKPFDTIIYCAGGGPHGDYFSKSIQSHYWAYQVNFFRPIEIADYLKSISFKGLFVYVGSAIAERSNSKKSLSYSISKKSSLLALLSMPEESLKVRVFSPPYMNTGLLPKHSWPRVEAPELVLETKEVAQALLSWLGSSQLNPSGGSDPRHFDWIKRFTYSLTERKEI